MTPRDKDLVKLLEHEWYLLIHSKNSLNKSVIKCQGIGLKDQYTFEEQESFDSFTSKFARTSDIFIQKVLRTIWLLFHEPAIPLIDLANRCEKEGIIPSADILVEIRDLRNQIAHEYLPEALKAMLPEVFRLTAELELMIGITEKFLLKRGWIQREI
jgi:hypothetical protein